MQKKKIVYEPPKLEVVEFVIEEAIAQSKGQSFFGTLGSEEIWGE